MNPLGAILVALILGWGPPSTPHVSIQDVVAMIDRLPVSPGHPSWSSVANAPEIAEAVASTVDGSLTGDVELDAALIVTYARYESEFRKFAIGDGGKAQGFLQIQHVPTWVAFEPKRAVVYWIAVAKASMALCVDNADDERLAALASGDCKRGRALVRRRMAVARNIVAGASVATVTHPGDRAGQE